jgi:hypothetical protein
MSEENNKNNLQEHQKELYEDSVTKMTQIEKSQEGDLSKGNSTEECSLKNGNSNPNNGMFF